MSKVTDRFRQRKKDNPPITSRECAILVLAEQVERLADAAEKLVSGDTPAWQRYKAARATLDAFGVKPPDDVMPPDEEQAQ